jgi:methylenetetrahydrofolate reductase (NADPH)
MKTESKLEKLLSQGKFVVTCECGPPKGPNIEVIKKKAEIIKDYVDAVNVTDCQTAVVRMSSIASCIILKNLGLEPIMQMTCRDRNRIAIQADILGAYAFGIRNILCLTGDHQKFGNHPTSKNVFDMDSIHLIQTVRKMRDENKFLSGDEIDGEVKMFIGGAENPFGDPFNFRAVRLAKKVKAGCDFIQTQCIYNIEKFEEWMKQVRDRGLHKQVYILAGVTPLKSVGMARYMKNMVAGMDIPDEIIDRLKSVPKEKVADEGIKICVETIEKLKNIEGVAGVHIMAIEWEEKVPEIVKMAKLKEV